MTRRVCPVCDRSTDAAACPEHEVPTIDPVILRAPPRVPQVGEVVAGRYALEEPLGVGGMAVVHRARDLAGGGVVAVKFMRPPRTLEMRHVKRFWREARALAAVQHDSVIGLYDFGIDEATHLPFLAMEYVEGETLGDSLSRQLLGERAAAAALAPVAHALAAAHEQGFAHRDLKPDNIMTTREGRVVVLDFGVAKALRAPEEGITAPGGAVGTPEYMSPEQARGGTLDPRSDLYSLGCVLHTMLSGRPPFEGESTAKIMDQHLGAAVPPPPRTLVDRRSPSLALLRLHAALLAKDPAGRPASAAVVAEIFESLARGDEAAASKQLAAALPSARARSGRAAIAAAPTGHALALDELVGLPAERALPQADTAVAPLDLERPPDEPSVMRTAPTAWALSRPEVVDAADTPRDAKTAVGVVQAPVVQLAREMHAEALDRTWPRREAVGAVTLPSTRAPVSVEPAPSAPAGRPRWLAFVAVALVAAVGGAVVQRLWLAPPGGVGGAAGVPGAVGVSGVVGQGADPIGAGGAVVGGGASGIASPGASPLASPGASPLAPASASPLASASASPLASALASPGASPIASPLASASASPLASAPASPIASPVASASASPSARPRPSATRSSEAASPRARPDDHARRSAKPEGAVAAESKVTITSTPPGARVLRDGAVIGQTPLTLSIDADVTVRVALEGYVERTVALRPGDGTRAVTLVPLW